MVDLVSTIGSTWEFDIHNICIHNIHVIQDPTMVDLESTIGYTCDIQKDEGGEIYYGCLDE